MIQRKDRSVTAVCQEALDLFFLHLRTGRKADSGCIKKGQWVLFFDCKQLCSSGLINRHVLGGPSRYV